VAGVFLDEDIKQNGHNYENTELPPHLPDNARVQLGLRPATRRAACGQSIKKRREGGTVRRFGSDQVQSRFPPAARLGNWWPPFKALGKPLNAIIPDEFCRCEIATAQMNNVTVSRIGSWLWDVPA